MPPTAATMPTTPHIPTCPSTLAAATACSATSFKHGTINFLYIFSYQHLVHPLFAMFSFTFHLYLSPKKTTKHPFLSFLPHHFSSYHFFLTWTIVRKSGAAAIVATARPAAATATTAGATAAA
jgi:hypothetical protein